MPPTLLSRTRALLGFVCYLGFVVYGSLIPFDFRPHSFAEALAAFEKIAYLNLDIVSRADWVANIVLYVPLAFLGCAATIGFRANPALRLVLYPLVFGFCLTVAVAVEFVQTFFEPRTVSLNDLLAELIGTALGVGLFHFSGVRLAELLDAFAGGGRASVLAALAMYFLAYIALALFPYDFLVAGQEFAWKWASGHWGLLIAGSCWEDVPRCLARQGSEIATIVPLGVLIALAKPGFSTRRVFFAGVWLGAVLELVQFFIASGTSQGLSLLWRGMGLAGGAALGSHLRNAGPALLARWLRQALPFLVLPYLLLLATLNGWFSAPWVNLATALARLSDLHVMPFYYHYFTTETAAMASLLSQATIYTPVGLAVWACFDRAGRIGGGGGRLAGAALWAMAVALPIELGKLFVPPKHPDFTDLVIAAGGAVFVCALLNWIERVLADGFGHDLPSAAHSEAPISMDTRERTVLLGERVAPVKVVRRPLGTLAALVAGGMVAIGWLAYPAGQAALVAALIGYALWLRKKPWLFVGVVPAGLALLDFSPQVGTLLLDEFDLIVLASLCHGYWRLYGLPARRPASRWLLVALGLLWLSWTAATLQVLWPLAGQHGPVDSSHSPLDAWLVGKGLLWALLFVPLLQRVPSASVAEVVSYAGWGIAVGVAGVALSVAWERWLFVGLTDFDNPFRATGPFASMRTGGAYIESFLAFGIPILTAGVLSTRSTALKLAGAGAILMATYALFVTFSRGGYAALITGLAVLAVAVCRGGLARRRLQPVLVFTGLAALSGAVAWPVVSGGFAQSRLARAGDDFRVRMEHWEHALQLMHSGLRTALFGEGFGTYPMRYALSRVGNKPPGSFSIMRETGNRYLMLGSGETVFLEQTVALQPGKTYLLSARIRSGNHLPGLTMSLCEKALLYSFACRDHTLTYPEDPIDWRLVHQEFKNETLGGRSGWLPKPVKLALHNPVPGSLLDVDDVSLMTPEGEELVVNGGFERGSKRWIFVTDQDLAWHIHQQHVELYFAQGWLGIAGFVVLLVAVARVLGSRWLAGSIPAGAAAAALAAFLTVGLLGSNLDTPRLSMLFYLGCFFAALVEVPEVASRQAHPRRADRGPQLTRRASAFETV